MKCSLCNNPVEKNGFCEIHYWKDVWLNNTDREHLGIVAFALMIVPEWVRDEVPDFHKSMYWDFKELYNSKHRDKYDRLLAEVAFRGAAKTTLSKILLLYVCCFGLEKLVAYCSETYDFAEQDVFEVRRELTTNPHIRHYFGPIKSQGVRSQDGEWTRGAFLTATGVYVLARGVGQQIRGALRNSYRVTLAIVNDIYSENDVKTEQTRRSWETWFFTAMLSGVDDVEGKVFFNGTILHEDTVPVKLKDNDSWKYHEYPIMDINDFYKALKSCEVTESKINLPPEEKIYEIQKSCNLYWPQRLDLRYILRKYKEAYESGQASGFFQDYFHITTSPDEKPFKHIRRAKMNLIRVHGRTWISVSFDGGVSFVTEEVNTYAGVDPASSTSQNAKYTAITYIGMNQYRQVYILGYSRGKFGMRDEYKLGYRKATDSDIVEPNRDNLTVTGMVDETIRLVKQHGILGVTVETIQQQKSVFTEINRIMRVNNAFHRLFEEQPHTNKIERDADLLGPYFQTGSIFLNYGLGELEHELEQFPRGVTVDIIDSLYYAIKNARPAEGMEYSDVMHHTHEEEEIPSFFVL